MGWVATAFLIVGRYYIGIGQMADIGLLLSSVGDFLWGLIGLKKRMISLAFTGGLMAVFDLIGWIAWMTS